MLPKSVQQAGLSTDRDVQKISGFFETLKDIKDCLRKLETTAFKTAIKLFLDMMKKLKNGIFPSLSEVENINLKATEAWTSLSDKDLEEKIKMSKIRMFSKTYEVLFNEETETFKPFEFLEPNKQNYLSEFMNSEISELEKISYTRLRKDKVFIDEIDQIKQLSYSTIKKEDFAFEQNGKISKYWTLNKNMVPEGEDDSLRGLDCTFKKVHSNIVTLKFRVYSDIYSKTWTIEVVSDEPFSSDLSFSLSAVESDCSTSSVPRVYFPEVETETADNAKIWSLPIKHLKYPDKMVTLIFSFVGTMDKILGTHFEENCRYAFLKTVIEEDLDLIRHINEYPFKVPIIDPVSMSLVVCNFLKNNLVVSDPHMSSGTLDSQHPWPRDIKPSSVALFHTRKRIIEARGSVGLTVITVQDSDRHKSFAVYWHAPFDFNLYKNSFAVFPLPGPYYSTSQDVMKAFKTFIEYNNTNKTDDKFDGIRGFAKDGPKALEFGGMLISVKMGGQHNDTLQLSILPLEQVENK